MSQENKFSKNDDYEVYEIKNNNETANNYKRKNDINTNIQEPNMSYLNKYKNQYLNTSPEKSYSYHSQIYINQNNQDSNRGKIIINQDFKYNKIKMIFQKKVSLLEDKFMQIKIKITNKIIFQEKMTIN